MKNNTTIVKATSNIATLADIQLLQVIEQLKDCDTGALVEIYNQYADAMSYERIYDNDTTSINDLYQDASDALRSAFYGDYNHSHNYFVLNGYANLESFDYVTDDNSPIDIEELAQWIVDNGLFNDYGITVTTLLDIRDSIEDNINDDKYLLSKLVDYLGQSLNDKQIEQLKRDDEYYEYLVEHLMNTISDYDYTDLHELINSVGINYSTK